MAAAAADPPSDRPQPAAHDAHVGPNARLGLVLFTVYFVLYLGFMGIATFAHEAFASTPFGGVNLAILYGMGLIVAALVLALVYLRLCKPE
ncbi:MAG TPA: DUF485 domain-containing protein [Tepidisphaeraceae bacterium]|jgi:uncharacterized membrane protein (DUF485 family)